MQVIALNDEIVLDSQIGSLGTENKNKTLALILQLDCITSCLGQKLHNLQKK